MNTMNSVALTTVALLFFVQQCAGYTCYVCSWTPSSVNRTDICTRENFVEDAVKTFDGCSYGCESVAVYDMNGELENFFRNCAVKGKKILNDCKMETTAAVKKEVCTCNSDLCNAASSAGPALPAALAAAILTIRLAVYG